jgi:hypothetical protein
MVRGFLPGLLAGFAGHDAIVADTAIPAAASASARGNPPAEFCVEFVQG